MIGPTDEEMRVLGCLLEKQRTVPDQYPLTLNSLRLACNQSTNRDPVVDYEEATVRRALGELGRRRWIRGASGHTSRVAKYRQLFEEEMRLDQDQVAVLAVLMLRGPQTPGELKQRADRMFSFHDLAAIHMTLDALVGRELVERLPRRPGQKEERYRQLVGGSHLAEGEEPRTSGTGEPAGTATVTGDLRADDLTGDAVLAGPASAEPHPVPLDTPEIERIERLERRARELEGTVGALRDTVHEIRDALDRLRTDLGA